jgi:hypothetical protein
MKLGTRLKYAFFQKSYYDDVELVCVYVCLFYVQAEHAI